jgi:hypothetical protein
MGQVRACPTEDAGQDGGIAGPENAHVDDDDFADEAPQAGLDQQRDVTDADRRAPEPVPGDLA